MHAKSFLVLILSLTHEATIAFSPSSTNSGRSLMITSTQLQFGIPTFGAGKDKNNDKDNNKKGNSSSEQPEKKIGMSGLVQLITAGMGSPFLGDFEGVDEETGKFMFSLEANNLVDENGKSKQTSMPYFESGWVSEEDLEKERLKKEKKGGGFFNLW